MKLDTVRGWQFTQLENNIRSIEWIVRGADPAALTTYRDGGNGWTILEVICHLRDMEAVYAERVHLAVEQENPPLPFPNPDQMAAERGYMQQDIDDALAELKRSRVAALAFLRDRQPDDWERVAQHPTRGPLTLFEQLALWTMHDTIHIEQMIRVLLEKKIG
jgi:hypothetical protein